jgi:hypothetical protein
MLDKSMVVDLVQWSLFYGIPKNRGTNLLKFFLFYINNKKELKRNFHPSSKLFVKPTKVDERGKDTK